MTAAGRPRGAGLSIGAVLSQLRPEFPDITISKIRFLETEGLVRPARTAAGYRQFSAADVARLRFVLAAQRDHYLPLKVIREQLDAVDRGETATGRPALTSVPPLVELADEPLGRLTRDELLDQTGMDQTMLAELEQYGLVRPDAYGHYDTECAEVARTVRALGDYGIEPRHLRAFRAAADREVGLLEQVLAPLVRQSGDEARGRADDAARDLATLSVGLHTLLLKAGLRRIPGR